MLNTFISNAAAFNTHDYTAINQENQFARAHCYSTESIDHIWNRNNDFSQLSLSKFLKYWWKFGAKLVENIVSMFRFLTVVCCTVTQFYFCMKIFNIWQVLGMCQPVDEQIYFGIYKWIGWKIIAFQTDILSIVMRKG